MTPDYRAQPDAGQWTPSFVLSTFGLVGFGLAILVVAALLRRIEPSTTGPLLIPLVLSAVAGVVVGSAGIANWVSARWVRRSVRAQRRNGLAAWPIRATSRVGRWNRVGVLVADEAGLDVIVRTGSLRVSWSELGDVEIKSGTLRGKTIELVGETTGRLEVELLQMNAAARAGEKDTEGFSLALRALHARAIRPTKRDV